jgi:hypothetical protein
MRALFLVTIAAWSMTASAQDYIGTYDAVPPPGLSKDEAHMKAWEMTRMRIEIMPTRVTWTLGSLVVERGGTISYTVNGPFLLVKYDRDGETYYMPIYVADKNTIFAAGYKLVRASGRVPEK